jgi:hypothetical protein
MCTAVMMLVVWDPGPNANTSTSDLLRQYRAKLEQRGRAG